LPSDVTQLIQSLLVRDPLRRLGSGPEDIKELEKAPFFSALDFAKVYRKEYTPIYKPNLGSDTDVANFDPTFTKEEAVDSVIDTSQLSSKHKNEFQGFTYEDTSVLAMPGR